MVHVEEGHADMLGYSFPCGTDVFVCSSSKQVISIEARHACRDGGSGGPSNHGTEVDDAGMIEGSEEVKSLKEALGCQLRFASHSLGQQIPTSGAGSGRNLSFRLVNDSHAVAPGLLDNIIRLGLRHFMFGSHLSIL